MQRQPFTLPNSSPDSQCESMEHAGSGSGNSSLSDSGTLWSDAFLLPLAVASPRDRLSPSPPSFATLELGAPAPFPPQLPTASLPLSSSAVSAVLTSGDVTLQPSHNSHVLQTASRHRSGEAHRRHKERAALRRLHDMCAVEGAAVEGSEQLCHTAAALSRPGHKRRRHKLSVLEASAARIQRLEELLNASELSNRVSEAQLSTLNDEISGMVRRERRGMQWLDASRALHETALLDDRLSYTLLDCRTGRLLDANSAFFSLTGFTPGGALQRVLDPVLASPDTTATPLSDIPLVRANKTNPTHVSSSRGPMQWVPLWPCRQYPGAVRLLHELRTAKRDRYRAPFRTRWLDGQPASITAQHSTPQQYRVCVGWLTALSLSAPVTAQVMRTRYKRRCGWRMWSGWRRQMAAGGSAH